MPSCEEEWKHFSTPLIYSVDGVVAKEANTAAKKLACHMAAKWKKTHSELCGYLSSRISIALVRSINLCLRHSRLYKCRPRAMDYGDGRLVTMCN